MSKSMYWEVERILTCWPKKVDEPFFYEHLQCEKCLKMIMERKSIGIGEASGILEQKITEYKGKGYGSLEEVLDLFIHKMEKMNK